MARYSGYISVVHDTYNNWRNATDGNGYDVDGYYGCQCWDDISLFYFNVGFPTGYPLLTNSQMYTMWNNRNQNVSYNGTTYFDIITNLADIKQGDIMVFDGTQANPYGHAGFADQDFATWIPDPNDPYEFPILSQNNGGTSDPAGGSYMNIHGYDYRLFLGGFRYRDWHTTPPTPPTPSHYRKGVPSAKFPFVLYARNLRNKR